MSMMLDTLKLAEDFKSAGFAEPQARALADTFRSLVDDDRLVTKEYLDFKLGSLEGKIESKLSDLRHDIDFKLNALEGKINGFDGKLKDLRYSMTLSLGSLMVAILTFFKVMDHFWR